MIKSTWIGVSMLAIATASPLMAQETTPGADVPSGTTQAGDPGDAAPPAPQDAPSYGEDIVVTAQRQSERLQDVPLAVSAFTAEALQDQQIENASDLQLSLPNVSFTKQNFTSSAFTIRGVGDLCIGFSCDSATAIHVNDIPLLSTRLFETEYFDLERVEVLRGPQGTLYGRNATSGVVNFITARPDLSGFGAAGSIEYGNYDSIKVNGMVNLPIGESIGIRVAGYYLNRDGYTYNEFDDTRIDGRDLYAIRGTLRFEPSPDTTLDLIGYYFREDDSRIRSQKQMCHRDPTGILGCQPDRLDFETFNGDSTLGASLSSRQFFALASLAQGGVLGNFGISNLLPGGDIYNGAVNIPDYRRVNVDFAPTYFAEELQILGKFEHDFGPVSFGLSGGYTRNEVDSRQDYTLTVSDNFGLEALARAGAAAARFPNSVGTVFRNGQFCVSDLTGDLLGQFGAGADPYICANNSTEYDRSRQRAEQWSVEGKLATNFDGPFNALIGGIYVEQVTRNGDYMIASTGLEYGAAVLGGANAADGFFLAPPYYANLVDRYAIKSYGIFGEVYYEFSDKLKLTLGARYSNDEKTLSSRAPILSVAGLIGTGSFDDLTAFPTYDADPSQPGAQPFRTTSVSFDDITGRAVLDYKITEDNLVYASYSRGYKSGGINPPFDPATFPNAPVTFDPENINAFEIGSKNIFGNGKAQINVSAFYYDYKNLQISRILARTSFNDNTNAEIYGLEIESILRPVPPLQFNINASYLHTAIKDLALSDPRDPSGGRSDVTIIKDVQNSSNCVLTPTAAGVSGDTLVALVNGFLNAATGPGNGGALFQPGTVPVPGTSARGAFSSCTLLNSVVSGVGVPAPLAALLAGNGITGALPFELQNGVLPDGVVSDLSGNRLPNAPEWKVSLGAQYTFDFDNGMTVVMRGDYNLTGDYYSRPQNLPIDRISSFDQINLQIQVNGADDRWFIRGFVQNLENDDSITGQYLTDPSSGLFTNVFTLDPRRYGVAAGFKF